MKAVAFELEEWERRIWPKIVADYGKAVNVSWVCKDRLGFTVRRHKVLISDDGHFWDHQIQIHLDFYTEASQTMFLLKYR